jgi:hypothetical protein
MALCSQCGLQNDGVVELCGHHAVTHGDSWAVGNRIMCAFFHRGIVPPRLDLPERDDNFWGPIDA